MSRDLFWRVTTDEQEATLAIWGEQLPLDEFWRVTGLPPHKIMPMPGTHNALQRTNKPNVASSQ